MSYPIGTIITVEVADSRLILEVCPKKRKEIKGKPQHFEVVTDEMELKPIPAPPAGTPVVRVQVDRCVTR